MKLSDKGPFRPPPALPDLLSVVVKEIQKWPDIVTATHWNLYFPDKPDGADYYLGDDEIGHIHFYGEAHIATDRALNVHYTQLGKAQLFRYRQDPVYRDWTQISITTLEQSRNAIELFRANYDRLRAQQGRS